jgi:hypothetical protein
MSAAHATDVLLLAFRNEEGPRRAAGLRWGAVAAAAVAPLLLHTVSIMLLAVRDAAALQELNTTGVRRAAWLPRALAWLPWFENEELRRVRLTLYATAPAVLVASALCCGVHAVGLPVLSWALVHGGACLYNVFFAETEYARRRRFRFGLWQQS